MEHSEHTDKRPAAPEQPWDSHTGQGEPGARMITLLEQCKAEMQRVEQRLAQVQTQFEVTQIRLNAVQAEIARHYPQSPRQEQAAILAEPASPQPTAEASSTEPAAEPAATEPMPAHGIYAYGIIEQVTNHFDIMGIDKQHKIYPVARSGLAVMVSKVDVGQFQEQVKSLYAALSQSPGIVPQQEGAILQDHESVIDAIMQQTAIVPLKFGTILKDEQAALRLLEAQDEDCKQMLARFHGKVECGLKVYADTQRVLKQMTQRELEAESAGEKKESLSKGAAYLLSRKKEEQLKDGMQAELAHVGERIFTQCGQAAFEQKQNNVLTRKATGKKKDMILNAAYLLGRDQVSAFYEQAKSINEQYAALELELEFSGPWPPYNFM